MGVRRSHEGLGRDVLKWASAEASGRGRRYLYLDCLSTNHRLRRYHEDHGFSMVGEMSGPIDHSHTVAHGPRTVILDKKAIYLGEVS
jgi:protein-tyrosine phosphatase